MSLDFFYFALVCVCVCLEGTEREWMEVEAGSGLRSYVTKDKGNLLCVPSGSLRRIQMYGRHQRGERSEGQVLSFCLSNPAV